MKVYSNTTPFIALCSVDLLHLMPALFSQINVATSVAQECLEGGKIVVPDLTSLPWIQVQDVPSSQQLPALFELDRGERDTLLLAAQQPGALVLIPSFVQTATGMRAQGIYFNEGLVNRIATRLGELN